jgi:two-component system cell cycle response regulator CtrA
MRTVNAGSDQNRIARMRVLLIEDDSATTKSIKMLLKSQRYVCDCTDLGEDGLEIAKLYEYDIIILDLMLPDMDGYDVLKRMRLARVETPVLILSGLGEPANKVKGFEKGADDYMTKPFDQEELIARIQAIVRRSHGYSVPAINVGNLTVNLASRSIELDDQTIPLTRTEFSIVELLARRKGNLISKETLLNHIYGSINEPDQKVVDVFICKIRKKLAAASDGDKYIRTVWGDGYVMDDPKKNNNNTLSAVP